jgi:outer membrane protein TolC
MPITGTGLVEQALATRQDLQALERRVAQASAAQLQARGGYLPTLYGSAGYQMHDRTTPFGRDNDGWFAGASLRWELFDGMGRPHAVEQASLQEKAAAEQLAEYRSIVALQVSESVMRLDEAEKRLESARNEQLAAAEGVRLVQKRYENSLSLFIELLDAQMNLNRCQFQLVDQEMARILAGAQVQHAVGIFLKEAGQ